MFTLAQVVPWGRTFSEYCGMFDLSEEDLRGRILGCGDGPASFNAQGTLQGVNITSVDPLYGFTRAQIQERIATTYDDMLEQTRSNSAEFVWDSIGSVEELGGIRLAAMETFLNDYEPGVDSGRYVNAALPTLPFPDASFDLALCGHFLFLYSAQLDLALHVSAIKEMCRVAPEARIFPLLALGGARSPFVDLCRAELSASGFEVTIDEVPYEFQRGGNQMMRVRRAHDR